MRELIVVLVLGGWIGACVFWLRRELRVYIAGLIAGGCPFVDMPAKLDDIDARLKAQEGKVGTALSTAEAADLRSRQIVAGQERAARIAGAKPVEQGIEGL